MFFVSHSNSDEIRLKEEERKDLDQKLVSVKQEGSSIQRGFITVQTRYQERLENTIDIIRFLLSLTTPHASFLQTLQLSIEHAISKREMRVSVEEWNQFESVMQSINDDLEMQRGKLQEKKKIQEAESQRACQEWQKQEIDEKVSKQRLHAEIDSVSKQINGLSLQLQV